MQELNNDYDIKKIFQEIELKLISSAKRTLWGHKQDELAKGFDWPQWQSLKLKQLKDYRENNKKLFEGYQENIDRYVYKQMKGQFEEGSAKVRKEAIKNGIISKDTSELGGSFFGVNERKINASIKAVTQDLHDVQYATLRMSDDVYRSTVFKAQMFVNTGATTVQQAIDMATKDFLTRGFNCIEYKDGSRHNIADYADMAVRTATKRANLMGEGEFRQQIGVSTVYISKHNTSCDKCSEWQGRVYIDDVWSGGTKEDGPYPFLSTAIEGGLFHPRCRHGSSTYFDGINEELQEVIEAKEHEHVDTYEQELARREQEYKRLIAGSLSVDNIKDYKNKLNDIEKLQNNSKNAILTEEEQYSINKYISSESYKINEALRNNKELTKAQQEIISNLDQAINKMPRYDGNIVRTLEIREKQKLHEFLDNMKVGDNRKFKEYLSFSNKKGYNDNANIEIWVNSKNGKDIRKYNNKESEILYKRDTTFLIKDKVRKDNKYYILLEE